MSPLTSDPWALAVHQPLRRSASESGRLRHRPAATRKASAAAAC